MPTVFFYGKILYLCIFVPGMLIRAVKTKTHRFAGLRKLSLSQELCVWQVHKYFELQSRTRGAIRWLLFEINFLKKCDLTFHSGKLPQDEFSFWWTSFSKRGSKNGQKHKIPALDTFIHAIAISFITSLHTDWLANDLSYYNPPSGSRGGLKENGQNPNSGSKNSENQNNDAVS